MTLHYRIKLVEVGVEAMVGVGVKGGGVRIGLFQLKGYSALRVSYGILGMRNLSSLTLFCLSRLLYWFFFH